MPIIYRKAPPEVDKIVKTWVEDWASKGAITTPILKSLPPGYTFAPSNEETIPVYHLGLSDIAESPDIKNTTKQDGTTSSNIRIQY